MCKERAKSVLSSIEIKHKSPNLCQYCGKEIKGTGKKYCSYACAQAASTRIHVSPNQLIEDFRLIKSYTGVAKKYNVCDNAIKKYTKRLGIYDIVSQYITHRKHP